ncbi:MAG: fumarylacetoacetate hydrolase family protein [Patulibacter sp.]|nr:fumarylacetoacetate hydrolase family protein [Patulibacter sp.]
MPEPWSLVTYRNGSDPETHVGVLGADGTIRNVPSLAPARDVSQLLSDDPLALDALRGLDATAGEAQDDAVLLAPLRFPRKVICAGANYAEHVRELGLEPTGGSVFFFLKPPTTTIVGPGDPIRIPVAEEARIDYEAELAVVIGRGGRDIPAERAMEHVAGYTIVNDVSARGLLARADPLVPAMGFDWISSKGRDTFCPVGPGVTPAWLVADPHDLRIELWVNGERRQDASTAGMDVAIPELIAQASAMVELEPGDVIATGTPAGVAMASGRFLRPGDEITIRVAGLGELSNPVVADR